MMFDLNYADREALDNQRSARDHSREVANDCNMQYFTIAKDKVVKVVEFFHAFSRCKAVPNKVSIRGEVVAFPKQVLLVGGDKCILIFSSSKCT
jgi:hypothetical protein